MSRLFLRKSVQDCENDILERGGLKRSLGKWHLTALGVGATIGAGIFATTGTAIVGDPLRPGVGSEVVILHRALEEGITHRTANQEQLMACRAEKTMQLGRRKFG